MTDNSWAKDLPGFVNISFAGEKKRKSDSNIVSVIIPNSTEAHAEILYLASFCQSFFGSRSREQSDDRIDIWSKQ